MADLQGKIYFGHIINHMSHCSLSGAYKHLCLGGDVLTRCMVEGSVAPIGGLPFERSHWSSWLLVAAVWQRDSSGVALPLIGGRRRRWRRSWVGRWRC